MGARNVTASIVPLALAFVLSLFNPIHFGFALFGGGLQLCAIHRHILSSSLPWRNNKGRKQAAAANVWQLGATRNQLLPLHDYRYEHSGCLRAGCF